MNYWLEKRAAGVLPIVLFREMKIADKMYYATYNLTDIIKDASWRYDLAYKFWVREKEAWLPQQHATVDYSIVLGRCEWCWGRVKVVQTQRPDKEYSICSIVATDNSVKASTKQRDCDQFSTIVGEKIDIEEAMLQSAQEYEAEFS